MQLVIMAGYELWIRVASLFKYMWTKEVMITSHFLSKEMGQGFQVILDSLTVYSFLEQPPLL